MTNEVMKTMIHPNVPGRAALEQAKAMREWQAKYGSKTPDLPD